MAGQTMPDANRRAFASKRNDRHVSSPISTQERDQIAARHLARRRRAHSWGLAAETWAALWLRFKGYRILFRRARTPAGEIDLIARRGAVLVAVEVKARPSVQAAIDAVSVRQRLRIARALDLVAARDPGLVRLTRRLDLVAMRPWRLPVHLEDLHRENR